MDSGDGYDYVDAAEEEVSRFVSVLVSETPRGAILVAGQFADTMLLRLLTEACRSPQAAKELADRRDAPLSTFSARILAAYAFGLLPEDEYWNLEQLRKMRNYCAHNMEAVSFADEKLKSHLDNLRVSQEFEKEEPIGKLSFVLSVLRTWCAIATSKLQERSETRLPALEAERFAAAHDIELGRKK